MEAIQALEILQGLESDKFELYFAGGVPAYDAGDYGIHLQEYVASAKLEKQVHFLGNVKNITELRRKMDLELVCSWCETFGRVTVEAMCAKLPVIGSNTGGTSEIIVEGQTGLLYELHNVKQLAQLISWCAEHPIEASQMAEKGYQRVKEHFAIETVVQKIYSVILEVTEENNEV